MLEMSLSLKILTDYAREIQKELLGGHKKLRSRTSNYELHRELNMIYTSRLHAVEILAIRFGYISLANEIQKWREDNGM